MSIGIFKVLRALLLSILCSAICLLLLAAFAITRDAPELWVSGCGRATLLFGALMAGFLGAKENNCFLGGLLSATLLLLLVLVCAPLFSSGAEMVTKWILLAIALGCGMLGSLLGSKRRAKVVRRKKKTRRG